MSATNRRAFYAELIRVEDLLHLQVEGTNLILRKNQQGEPVLGASDADQPCLLHVLFAPQTIAESAFFEAAIVPGGSGPIVPENGPKRTDPDQSNTAHDPLPAPGHLSTQAVKQEKGPTVAQLGRPTRLVFTVPEGTEIPFTVAGLLDWSSLQLSVSGIAAIGEGPSAEQIANAPAIKEPAATETSIELPYRLVISPTSDATWLHRLQPFTSNGRTEMWHTHLALKDSDGNTVELSRAHPAPLRAIWSQDYDPNKLPDVQDDPHLGRTAMCANDRAQIVILTSGFHGYVSDQKIKVRKQTPISRTVPFVPTPFYAERLMLSSLGGWLRSRGEWDPPRRLAQIQGSLPQWKEILKLVEISRPLQERKVLDHPTLLQSQSQVAGIGDRIESESLDLSAWTHVATQGRDHYVRIVYEGELWPFRHPAALIKVTERKFQENNGMVGAYLMQRMFIIVRKPEMVFGDMDFGNPLKKVRLTTLVTPDIADPRSILGTQRSFWVEVMTGPDPANRADFRFHAIGQDVAGNVIDFTVPMMFVSKTDYESMANTAVAVSAYNNVANLKMRNCNVPGQKVAYAPADPAKLTDTTELTTDWLNFVMDPARVQPELLKAEVTIPQVQELLGAATATSIRLYPDFVNHGLHAENQTGVFAEVVDDSYAAIDPAPAGVQFPVNISADKAGGMATPNLGVTALSRSLGPLAGRIADAASNRFDPAQFFPKGLAMLFGSFDLLDLFLPEPATPTPMSLDENAPKMRTERQAGPGGETVVVTTFDWKPKFLEPTGKLDLTIAAITKDHNGTSVLDISGTIRKPISLSGAPAGDASSNFSGSLNAFQVSVLSSVFINFESFSFSKKSGHKADVKVTLDPGKPLEFGGDLAFIEEIRNAIPPGLFGDGPSLELIDNPLGIRAGFAFALPPLTVAVFTLKDVELGAALTLPFLDGKPVFDFNISERAHPFLLAVAIFGGGGFFHLQLDTAGMRALEVALEFGATAALDLGVASGEVHMMAGIYFSLQRKEGSTDLTATLTGYLRLGGSLNVLGIISISVEFNLSFTYDGSRDKAYGRATLTVSVHVLMFSASVDLTVERAFGGSGDPHFSDFFPQPGPWNEYALAFA